MVFSFDFRLLIAATSHVPVGAATGAEEELVGADDRSAPVGAGAAATAAATVSHEQRGAQSDFSLHMRWAPMIVAPVVPEHWLSKALVQGRLASQIWLAAVQPPQWAVVPHVYWLHLWGGRGVLSAVAIRE
tara:strand:+ start:960 stop:1352 length:393 start_codon:yes stop_codon:yes gene_type:complete